MQKSLNISHIGLGGMGRAVQNIAHTRGHKTASSIEAQDAINLASLNKADIAIECTVPHACLENIKKCIDLKQDTLVVTTGWYDNLDEIKKIVKKSRIRFMYSSNYSIGVNLYFRMIEASAKLINKAEEYDVWGTEIHHKNKVDSPSGTAKTLEEILLKNIDRKTIVCEEKLDRKIEDHEIHFSSTRGGLVNFEHTVGFDSEADIILIKHAARNRDGYALGAVKAAEWLNQQKPGFYTMDDFLADVLS